MCKASTFKSSASPSATLLCCSCGCCLLGAVSRHHLGCAHLDPLPVHHTVCTVPALTILSCIIVITAQDSSNQKETTAAAAC
jgi:hypothetical protein